MAAGDLLNRLSGEVAPKLPVHQFWAALSEWTFGEVSRQDVIDAFGIQANEEADLDWLFTKYTASSDKPAFLHLIHSLFILAEVGYFGYNVKATMTARINAIP